MPISRIETNSIAPSQTLTTPIIATTMGVGGATPSGSGSGITFPATQSASSDVNTLDDYEEGTWTPVFASGDIISGGLTPTYNTIATKGLYRKIGAVVFVSFQISLTSLVVVGSPVQDIYIEGLPYIPTSSRPYQAMQVVYGSASNFSTNSPSFGSFLNFSITAATGSISVWYKTAPNALTFGFITGLGGRDITPELISEIVLEASALPLATQPIYWKGLKHE